MLLTVNAAQVQLSSVFEILLYSLYKAMILKDLESASRTIKALQCLKDLKKFFSHVFVDEKFIFT